MMCFHMLKLVAILALVNCCVFKVVLCHNNDNAHNDNGNTLSPKQLPEERVRFPRAIDSEKRTSCSSRDQCTGNQTVFETTSAYYNCYCDNACYETFQDCCPDFVATCGKQTETDRKTSENPWKCVDLHLSELGDRDFTLLGPEGIWMIHNCPRTWPLDETASKCQNAPGKFSHPLDDFLPVVGDNKLTYRNKHCAICNGEQQYTTWKVIVKAFLIPPTDYSFYDKMWFILANGGYVEKIMPDSDMPRRYCAGKKYKDTCSNMTHPDYNSCVKGPVETVGQLSGRYYKNKACAYCNGESEVTKPERSQKNYIYVIASLSEGLSVVFIKRSRGSSSNTQVVEKYCPAVFVYDETLEYCREGLVTSADDTLSHVFLVALWFKRGSIKDLPPVFAPTETSQDPVTNLTQHLNSALMEKFGLGPNQVTELRFHRQDYQSTVIVATFRLTLTPYQDFLLANKNNTANLNISSDSLKFIELLKFTSNFTVYSGTFRFPVIKLTAQQLACFQGMTLQPHEYETDKKTGDILQNTTGRNFSRNDYTILEREGGNITICRKLVLSNCNNGSYVPLNETEYFIYQNLTVFHYATNRTFNFGEYQMIESSFNARKLDSPQNVSLPRNSRIAVCLPLRGTFTKTVVHFAEEETSLALRILTLIGFSISVFFLLLLLVTYGIFKELRTLPGLNLMSLSVSMLLSHIIWLIGTAHFQGTKVCEVLGILQHYLFLVSFMGMSVISYHSCVVFSRPFGTSSNSTRRFVKYSAIVWLTPALLVAVCVILDQTDTTFDIYGDKCWLETNEAVLYFFLLPVAVSLVCNIYTFIKTALALSRSKKDTRILQQDRKQNLLICAKLATLVGFPWIFAFFGVVFPDVEAFEYLFVIFVCLQGFYIGIAFVLNKKTRQLYRKWWKNENTTTAGSTQPTPTFQMS